MSVGAAANPISHLVGMGQIAIFSAPESARIVLGSCVGVALFDEQRSTAAVAHVVLPDSEGRSPAAPGKFANTAVESMVKSLIELGASPRRISAKIAGGSTMFVGKGGPFQIGASNIEAVRAALLAHSIRLLAEHLGGSQGRKVTVCPKSRDFSIEIVGQPTIQI